VALGPNQPIVGAAARALHHIFFAIDSPLSGNNQSEGPSRFKRLKFQTFHRKGPICQAQLFSYNHFCDGQALSGRLHMYESTLWLVLNPTICPFEINPQKKLAIRIEYCYL
jgi:hypothetical protein